MCATDQNIVCLVNASKKGTDPDTLIAFYRTTTDTDGNPVEQYSYAFSVTETDYEHGNGMTYNSKTNEIYVMPGPCLDKENEGNIYVVDADTLHWKRTFQSSSGQNFGWIEYLESTDQYVVSGGNGSKFRLMNSDFEILKIIAPRTKPAGSTYQDFCVTGDYIISPCYDGESKVDNYFVITLCDLHNLFHKTSHTKTVIQLCQLITYIHTVQFIYQCILFLEKTQINDGTVPNCQQGINHRCLLHTIFGRYPQISYGSLIEIKGHKRQS